MTGDEGFLYSHLKSVTRHPTVPPLTSGHCRVSCTSVNMDVCACVCVCVTAAAKGATNNKRQRVLRVSLGIRTSLVAALVLENSSLAPGEF